MSDDPRAGTVDGLLRRSARRAPDRVALTFADRSWTYRQLDEAVSRAAGHLLGLGLRPGDRVAAYGRNSDAYAIAFLACARAGLVHVPVNHALTGEELRYLLGQSGTRAVLSDPALAPEVERVRDGLAVEHVLPLREDPAGLPGSGSPKASLPGTGFPGTGLLEAASAGPVPELGTGPADTELAQLLYTSGTTSRPKGAMMPHRALVHAYLSALHALDLREDDRPLICMPLYHSAALHVFLLPYLAVGASVLLLESPDIPELLRRIEGDRIGSLFLAPTVWVPLANHPDLDRHDLSSLRKAQYGASIMPVAVLDRLRARYPQVGFYNCFGQSEIGPLSTVLRPEEHLDRPASCGRPVLFVETRVVDRTGTEVPPGTPGEVVYRSPQLCLGYWDSPEQTAEAFKDGWFHSGDLVVADEAGYLTVVDRIKDVINTGGVLVASREVEEAVYSHPAVAEVAVIGVPDEKWIEAVTAFVVLRPGSPAPTAAELIAHVRSRLAPFKVPKKVLFVTELPRNQSGKLLKRELRDRASGIR
ncbi:acyl-CoA synthetase [Kitasatospora sp. NPDC059827]|uniref:acyl-CoA synthetase n=1 Tax=Kitasatospora sp. NPDC059827 TaxID=3346964 RepID=UPI003664E216